MLGPRYASRPTMSLAISSTLMYAAYNVSVVAASSTISTTAAVFRREVEQRAQGFLAGFLICLILMFIVLCIILYMCYRGRHRNIKATAIKGADYNPRYELPPA